MPVNYGDDDSHEDEESPERRVKALAGDIKEDVEEAFEFDELKRDWGHSVAFVDEADVEKDWWDAEIPAADDVPHDVDAFRDDVRAACEELVDSMSAVEQDDADEEAEGLTRALFSVTRLDAAADAFDTQLSVANRVFSFSGAAKTVYKKVKNWITKKLKPVIKNISNQLWKLLKKVKNLKEWTLSGDLGVGVLGLHGSAGIALTFD